MCSRYTFSEQKKIVELYRLYIFTQLYGSIVNRQVIIITIKSLTVYITFAQRYLITTYNIYYKNNYYFYTAKGSLRNRSLAAKVSFIPVTIDKHYTN